MFRDNVIPHTHTIRRTQADSPGWDIARLQRFGLALLWRFLSSLFLRLTHKISREFKGVKRPLVWRMQYGTITVVGMIVFTMCLIC